MNTKISTKRHTSAGQKALAFGLASATCLGVVGLISVRNAQEATAADTTDQVALAAATTSTGVTQAQLDQYAAQLAAEQARLEAYRLRLIDTANSLAAQARTGATVTKPKRVPKKPKAKVSANSGATSSTNNYVAQDPAPSVQSPTVQAPPSRQFVPAPQSASGGNSWAAPAPQAKTRASKG